MQLLQNKILLIVQNCCRLQKLNRKYNQALPKILCLEALTISVKKQGHALSIYKS